MACYDVCSQRGSEVLLLDVQADLLEQLNTRVVVPLMRPEAAPMPARRLNPVFDLPDGPRVMVTQYLSTVSAQSLEAPVANLGDRAEEVQAALGVLMKGI